MIDGICVVTGATGHVGSNLVRALLSRGRKIRAVVQSPTPILEEMGVQTVLGDVLDVSSLQSAFEGAGTVFHLAAVIPLTVGKNAAAMEQINVQGPRNVVAACRQAGVERLVHVSSIHAFYGHGEGMVVSEETPLVDWEETSASLYDRTKAAGQRAVMESAANGLHAVVVNPTGVIGPYDPKLSPMGEVITKLARGTLPAVVDGGFNWVDARDLAEGILAAETKGRCGDCYIMDGHFAHAREVAGIVSKITGVRSPRFSSPLWLAQIGAPFAVLAGRMTGTRPLYCGDSLHALRGHQNIDGSKARRELGFSPRSLEETIEDILAWHGLLPESR